MRPRAPEGFSVSEPLPHSTDAPLSPADARIEQLRREYNVPAVGYGIKELGPNSILVEILPSQGALPNCVRTTHAITKDTDGTLHVEGGSPHTAEEIPSLLAMFRARLAAFEWDAVQGLDPVIAAKLR